VPLRCRSGLQAFKRQYALRAFPTLLLFPAGVGVPVYFPVKFEDENTTAEVLIDVVTNSALRTDTTLADIPLQSNIHAAIMALVRARAAPMALFEGGRALRLWAGLSGKPPPPHTHTLPPPPPPQLPPPLSLHPVSIRTGVAVLHFADYCRTNKMWPFSFGASNENRSCVQ
jgi:hypothetical protein